MEVSGRFLSISSKDERGSLELNKQTGVRGEIVMLAKEDIYCTKSD
jgi:hypothetical protein